MRRDGARSGWYGRRQGCKLKKKILLTVEAKSLETEFIQKTSSSILKVDLRAPGVNYQR